MGFLKKRGKGLKQELASFTKDEKLFCFFSMLSCFSIALEYAITRPASHALFLSTFSSKAVPYLWLAVVPVNFVMISLYNRFLPKIKPLKMWAIVSSIVLIVNLGAAKLLPIFPKYILFQCIWKDIYILLMFKQLWSMIHCTIPQAKAKYLYGVIFASGTIGSCFGSFVPGFMAIPFGSENLFYLTLPIYLLLFVFFRGAYRRGKATLSTWQDSPGGIQAIVKNRFLIAILLLVVFMQLSSGFMEYRFNIHLEENFFDKDLRTAICARLFGIMNIVSLGVQAIGAFFFIHLIGVKRIHFLIPLSLLGITFSNWMLPSFALISFSYVFLKSIDFSLFSVAREMLYIPFGLNEKFRAKAVIDVFAYRAAKALASITILGLQTLITGSLLKVVTYLSFAIFISWMIVVIFMLHNEQPERAA